MLPILFASVLLNKKVIFPFCTPALNLSFKLDSLSSFVKRQKNVQTFSSQIINELDENHFQHPAYNKNSESFIFNELKEVISLLGRRGTFFDDISGCYYSFRRKILQLNNDHTHDVDELFNIFEEDTNLYLIKNSTYILDRSINVFTKLKIPTIIDGSIELTTDSELKEYAIKLEIFSSIHGLISLWNTLKDLKKTKPLLDFVSNLILIRSVKLLKFEEIQYLILAESSYSKSLPTNYGNSEDFYTIKHWISRSSILQEVGLRGLCVAFFDSLFLRLYSIGKKQAIFSYLSIFKEHLLLYGPIENADVSRKIFRILLDCSMCQKVALSSPALLDTPFYLNIAGSPSNTSLIFAQSKFSKILANVFQPNQHSDLNLIDGKAICSLTQWVIQNLQHDPKSLSTNLEQIYQFYLKAVESHFKGQDHLNVHATLSYLVFLAKYFISQKKFLESFHVLSILIPRIHAVFEQHLSIRSKKFSFIYLDVFCRSVLMLSTVFESILREIMLRLPQHNIVNSFNHRNPTLLNNMTSSRLFSFERIEPSLPMKGCTFIALLYNSLLPAPFLLFKMEDLHSDSFKFISSVDELLSAKIRLSMAILPPLVNFSYNSAFSFLSELKNDEHTFQKIQSSDPCLPHFPGVHSLNFVLGIASLAKSICSPNMKDLVYDYFFKDFEGIASSNNLLPKSYEYRFLETVNSLLASQSAFPQKIVNTILRLGIKLDFLSICLFCRGFFAILLTHWLNDSTLEASTSYITSFICRLIESPKLLGNTYPEYPIKNFTLSIEYDSMEFPFLSLSSQFLSFLKGVACYPKALNIYSSIIKRQIESGISIDDHYDFRYNFINNSYLFLSQWDVFQANTPISALVPLIWSRICQHISSAPSKDLILCQEVFYEKDSEMKNEVIESITKSVAEFIKSVTLSDVKLWISILEENGLKTFGSLRQLSKGSFNSSFPQIPSEACYLILNYCVKPSNTVEVVPFALTNQVYSYYSPVLNSKSGRFVLAFQNQNNSVKLNYQPV